MMHKTLLNIKRFIIFIMYLNIMDCNGQTSVIKFTYESRYKLSKQVMHYSIYLEISQDTFRWKSPNDDSDAVKIAGLPPHTFTMKRVQDTIYYKYFNYKTRHFDSLPWYVLTKRKYIKHYKINDFIEGLYLPEGYTKFCGTKKMSIGSSEKSCYKFRTTSTKGTKYSSYVTYTYLENRTFIPVKEITQYYDPVKNKKTPGYNELTMVDK